MNSMPVLGLFDSFSAPQIVADFIGPVMFAVIGIVLFAAGANAARHRRPGEALLYCLAGWVPLALSVALFLSWIPAQQTRIAALNDAHQRIDKLNLDLSEKEKSLQSLLGRLNERVPLVTERMAVLRAELSRLGVISATRTVRMGQDQLTNMADIGEELQEILTLLEKLPRPKSIIGQAAPLEAELQRSCYELSARAVDFHSLGTIFRVSIRHPETNKPFRFARRRYTLSHEIDALSTSLRKMHAGVVSAAGGAVIKFFVRGMADADGYIGPFEEAHDYRRIQFRTSIVPTSGSVEPAVRRIDRVTNSNLPILRAEYVRRVMISVLPNVSVEVLYASPNRNLHKYELGFELFLVVSSDGCSIGGDQEKHHGKLPGAVAPLFK
jgi:hypothetical protein